MSEVAVEARDLVKGYGSRTVLDGVSFTVARGEMFTILGPNGAGKTTTVEILEGYRKPDSGTALILGESPGTPSARSKTGLMLQEGGIYPGIKVSEALSLFASYYPSPMQVDEVMGVLRIQHLKAAKFRTLSGGEKQRISLALAIVGSPRVLFLDEPTTGMDPIARADTWEMLQRMSSEGVTVILTTHGLQEAEYLSDRIAILESGRIRASGTLKQLLADDTVSFTVTGRIDLARMCAETGLEIELRGGRYVTKGMASQSIISLIARSAEDQGATISDMRTGQTLDDLYRGLVGEE